MEYSQNELMISAAARELRGARVAFVGVGLPNIVCNLGQRLHAPALELVYEAGVFGARPARLPLSIGDPTIVTGAASVMGMPDLFQYYLQRGLIDVGFLGAAQIDKFGNINTTVIGAYAKPKTRLPGSGGAAEIAVLCGKILVITRLNKRAFVPRVDFITSPGYLEGGAAREKLKARGRGPEAVITDLCVLRFAADTREMMVTSLHPNVTRAQVEANIGWQIRFADALETTEPPSAEELRLIREELDPQRLYSR
ncbi:MAG: 3-oxoadipate--succinyl-CoA transferase subunit B [Chloroflexi bacterium UTCFX4]|jgi:glutaconate CoA-transferase subunit B|nr:MAG: 3-oxoadipate--succinyl-CoA transferase subunit B [Chloroflexi bacterium UTCFX4]